MVGCWYVPAGRLVKNARDYQRQGTLGARLLTGLILAAISQSQIATVARQSKGRGPRINSALSDPRTRQDFQYVPTAVEDFSRCYVQFPDIDEHTTLLRYTLTSVFLDLETMPVFEELGPVIVQEIESAEYVEAESAAAPPNAIYGGQPRASVGTDIRQRGRAGKSRRRFPLHPFSGSTDLKTRFVSLCTFNTGTWRASNSFY